MKMIHRSLSPLLLLFSILLIMPLQAQRKKKKSTATSYPESLYSSMQYREIGPFRGGRSAADGCPR